MGWFDSKTHLLLTGGAVVGAGVLVLASNAYDELETGNDNLDRFPIRGRVLVYSELYGVDPNVVMAIVHNESNGDPSNYLGDATLGGGPSIGPMQVYRKTAKDYGLWTPPSGISSVEDERAAYAELSDDEGLGIRWGIQVLKHKLAEQGDIHEAIRAYNGSGPNAEAYRDKAIAWIDKTYGDNPTS